LRGYQLDLSDEGHQALDEGVLSLFGLNIELNKEPDDMASLLWAIIHSDPRLMILMSKATALLERESSLMVVLRGGWNAHSFM